MRAKKAVSGAIVGLLMLGSVPFALAQQSEETPAQTEAQRKLKVLEEQIQTLEAKAALKENADDTAQKEFDEYYNKVEKQLNAWDDWIDETHGGTKATMGK
jgi:hypothetical protein